jgi:copper transport protein
MVSVGFLVLTGGFAAWLHLPAFQALWTTTYGLLLALKLVLAAILILLGALNARILARRLGSIVGARALRRTAMAELLVAQVVLVITAILVRTAPM